MKTTLHILGVALLGSASTFTISYIISATSDNVGFAIFCGVLAAFTAIYFWGAYVSRSRT